MKKLFILCAPAIAAFALLSCQGEGSTVVDLENPTSAVSSLYLVDTEINLDPEGFNMITDGGFERFAGDSTWKTKSLWWFNEENTESEEPCTGSRSIRLFHDGDGWFDLAVQTINVKKGASYTLSLKYRGAWQGLNCYMGFRASQLHDTNTNTAGRNDAWDEGYTYKWENVDDTQANVFFGGFWWYGLWVELDDVRVIPTGSSNDSYIPSNATVIATSVPSAAKIEVTSAAKAVVSASAEVGMLHNAVIDGATVENAYITTGLNNNGELVIASVVATEVRDFVPTAVIEVNGTSYVHGYSGYIAANEELEASITKAAILTSTDGNTWNEVITFPDSSKFAKAAFCEKGDYVYIFGNPIAEGAVNTYVARVAKASLGEVSEYEYWDGDTYLKGTELIAASVFYGPVDCMSVVYNEAKYAFMAVYRSRTTGQLVYRDAGLAEGEWSGEKLLVADPSGVVLYAPQIVVCKSGKLVMVASKK